MSDETQLSSVSFASGKKFIQSIRHQGLTIEEAVKEPIDNSIDAQATTIWIEVWKDAMGVNILIQDDGRGMEPNKLQSCVAFGESDNDDNASRIGKFGFGLPSAITSRTKTADVYSKKKGSVYYRLKVDLNIVEGDPLLRLPKVDQQNPKKAYGNRVRDVTSGTIVTMTACDRLDVKKPETIVDHLVDDLEETYREYIFEGNKIFINGKPLSFADPLMSMKGHKYAEELRKGIKQEELNDDIGYSKMFEVDPIPIEYENENGKKGTGYIRVKIAQLPRRDIARTGGGEKYDISVKTSGFYIMRNGRQISRGSKLGIIETHNRFNYFRGQVEFDPCLDLEFGVQVNKSRFTVSTSVKDKIKNKVQPLIAQIVKETEEIGAELRAKKEKDGEIAEKIAKDNPIRNPKAVRVATEEDIQRAIETEVKAIDATTFLGEDEKKKQKEIVRVMLEQGIPFTITEERNKQGPIFTWEYLGKTTKVVLNTEHPFYQYFWVPLQGSPYYRTMMKILVFTLVKGEQMQKDELTQGNPVSAEELHNYWSMVMRKYLGSAAFLNFEREARPEGDDDLGSAD